MRLTSDIENSVLSMREISKDLRASEMEERPWKGDIKPPKKLTVWADEDGPARVEFLKLAWDNRGKYPFADDIAKAISSKFRRNISKSAVISKAHNLGLGARGTSAAMPKSDAPSAQIARAEKTARPPFLGTALRLDPMPETGLEFEDLRRGMCHWPLGGVQDAPRFFCAEEAKGTYCDRHRAISIGATRRPAQ